MGSYRKCQASSYSKSSVLFRSSCKFPFSPFTPLKIEPTSPPNPRRRRKSLVSSKASRFQFRNLKHLAKHRLPSGITAADTDFAGSGFLQEETLSGSEVSSEEITSCIKYSANRGESPETWEVIRTTELPTSIAAKAPDIPNEVLISEVTNSRVPSPSKVPETRQLMAPTFIPTEVPEVSEFVPEARRLIAPMASAELPDGTMVLRRGSRILRRGRYAFFSFCGMLSGEALSNHVPW